MAGERAVLQRRRAQAVDGAFWRQGGQLVHEVSRVTGSAIYQYVVTRRLIYYHPSYQTFSVLRQLDIVLYNPCFSHASCHIRSGTYSMVGASTNVFGVD